MKKSLASNEYKLFLEKLAFFREKAGLTQEQLAARIGETQSFVSKVERGERRIDLIEFLEICRALDISPVEFIKELLELMKMGPK